MNLKEKINAIKESFNSIIGIKNDETPESQKFSIIVLKDGTKISVDALEVGNVVSKIVDDVAEDIAAGEYEMEDGTIIVVGDDSKIAEVKKAEEKPEEDMAETPTEGQGEDKSDTTESDIESRISKLEENVQIIADFITNDIMPYIQKSNEEMKAEKKEKEEMSSKFNSFKEEVDSKFKMIEALPSMAPQHFKNDKNEIDKNLSKTEQARLKMLEELNNYKK